jgi:hypothetical protein
MKKVRLFFICPILIFGFSVSAFGLAELSIETHSYNDPIGQDIQKFTVTDKVSYSNFPSCPGGGCVVIGGYGWASGYADATKLDIGVCNSAGSSDPAAGGSSQATAYMSNTFTILDSSVANGTLVTLQLNMHLDGSIIVGGGAQTQGHAALGIVGGSTIPRPGQGEFWQPESVSFTTSWNLFSDGSYYRSQIGWQANKIGYKFYDQNGYQYNYYGSCTEGEPHCYWSETYYSGGGVPGQLSPVQISLDVPLVLNFDAYVGSTYTLFEYMDNLSDFGGGAIGGSDVDFSHAFTVTVTSDNPNIVLTWGVPLSTTAPGDIDGSGAVQIADAILALQVISKVSTSPSVTIHTEADINGDGKIGLPEAIYILQKAAGLR